MSNIYLLSNENVEDENIIHLPIFEIKYIKNNTNLQQYDALIFTSKNAIKSFEVMNYDYKKIPSYVISHQTAQCLNTYNANVKYISKAKNANDFAKDIIKELKNKKVLYIRAKKVVSKLSQILNKNNVLCDELISYDNICKTYEDKSKPKKNSIIIFTSPSSIKCFLSNFTWDMSYKAVCIGKTTSSFLPKDIKYFISNDLSINSCISLAKRLVI